MTDCSKNSLKVNLENFQSISNAELNFEQGINIIVGESNSGKSAILRAIKGAILNPNGSQKYIKNKTNGFKVDIDYEGNEIEWSRGGKSPKYVVNGEEYLKVGNSNLTDILDNSGFVLDENKNLMNIESELELPFPFALNNSELFKLFEKNIFCISDSTAITKLIKADEDSAKLNKERAGLELETQKQKLQAVSDLEAEVDLNKLINGREVLAGLLKKKEATNTDINKLSDIISVGKVLSVNIPIVDIDNDILHTYKILLDDTYKLEEIKNMGNVLSKNIPQCSSTADIKEYEEIALAVTQADRAIQLLSILSPLEAPTLNFMNEEYTSLRNDINELLRLTERAQNAQKEISDLKKTIGKLSEEKSKYKVCPLCGSNINE